MYHALIKYKSMPQKVIMAHLYMATLPSNVELIWQIWQTMTTYLFDLSSNSSRCVSNWRYLSIISYTSSNSRWPMAKGQSEHPDLSTILDHWQLLIFVSVCCLYVVQAIGATDPTSRLTCGSCMFEVSPSNYQEWVVNCICIVM